MPPTSAQLVRRILLTAVGAMGREGGQCLQLQLTPITTGKAVSYAYTATMEHYTEGKALHRGLGTGARQLKHVEDRQEGCCASSSAKDPLLNRCSCTHQLDQVRGQHGLQGAQAAAKRPCAPPLEG